METNVIQPILDQLQHRVTPLEKALDIIRSVLADNMNKNRRWDFIAELRKTDVDRAACDPRVWETCDRIWKIMYMDVPSGTHARVPAHYLSLLRAADCCTFITQMVRLAVLKGCRMAVRGHEIKDVSIIGGTFRKSHGSLPNVIMMYADDLDKSRSWSLLTGDGGHMWLKLHLHGPWASGHGIVYADGSVAQFVDPLLGELLIMDNMDGPVMDGRYIYSAQSVSAPDEGTIVRSMCAQLSAVGPAEADALLLRSRS